MLLSTQVLALARPALAIEEATQFTFSDTSVGAAAAASDLTKANATKARTSPVNSSGEFTSAVSIDVPPGRRGATPQLALTYTSGAARHDSAFGAGWSLSMPTISRSTRNGMPKLVEGGGPLRYDPAAHYESHSGEIAPTTHGPPTSGTLFGPIRESEPSRYEYLDDVEGGRWVEHRPDGKKLYYGADPFTPNDARVNTELGAFSWLLVREEDAFGNDITYSYHNIADQDRADRTRASRVPVVSEVRWGGNRVAGLPPAFRIQTDISGQEGPLNAMDGNTLLDSKVDRLRIIGPNATLYWSYELTYSTSADSGRLLLKSATRSAPGEAPTVTTFGYSQNTSGPRFAPPTPLPSGLAMEYVERKAFGTRHPYDIEWETLDRAFGQFGHGSGYQFYAPAGARGAEVHYMPSGISAPQSLPTGNRSYVYGASGSLARMGNGVFPMDTLVKSLADMDGDGDVDAVSFPLAYKVADGSGPSAYLRAVTPMSSCLDTAFWNTCGDAEPLRPSVSNVGNGTCRGIVSGCLTPHFNQPQPVTVGKQLLRIGRDARRQGAPIKTTHILNDWPMTAFQRVQIEEKFANPGPASPSNPSTFNSFVWRDFQAPVTDINGDGRADVVLFKQQQHIEPFSDIFGRKFTARLAAYATERGKSPEALLLFLNVFRGAKTMEEWQARKATQAFIEACDRLNIPTASADSYWASAVNDGIFQPLFEEMQALSDEDYQATAQNFVDIYDCACEQTNPENPPIKHMSIRGAPSPFGPGGEWRPGGPSGPFGPGGPHDNPIDPWVPNRFGRDPNDWCGTMWGPKSLQDYLDANLRERFDANGGVIPFIDDSRTLPRHLVKFVPRVYLADDTTQRSFAHESEPGGRPGRFGSYLRTVLNRGSGEECGSSGCEYPPHRNFSSLLLDVNADGLPDLVRATPPMRTTGGVRACVGGHKVDINKGYTWAPSASVSSALRFEPETSSDPLALLRNRDGKCVDLPDFGGGMIPPSAMVPTDINGDGRVDWVLAFERRDPALSSGGQAFGSDIVQAVFLNTGRGFKEVSSAVLPPDLALSIFIQPGILTLGRYVLPSNPAAWPDSARFVDFDNDGLVDILEMGFCKTVGFPLNTYEQCPTVGRWRRNIGVTPDLLISEESSRGAQTQIQYAPGNDPAIVELPGAPGMVVKQVTHVPRPYVATPGLGLPAFSSIAYKYKNYVHDTQSTEAIGFESVKFEARNVVDGVVRQQVTTTEVNDVREYVPGASGALLGVRFPFKGGVNLRRVEDAGGSSETTTYRGGTDIPSGVRVDVRSVRTYSCGNGVCNQSQREVLARDTEGFPTLLVEGQSDGVQVVAGHDTRRTSQSYEHRTDSRWQLGLPTHSEVHGPTERIDGVVSDAILSAKDLAYGSRGELESESTPAANEPGCSPVGANTTTHAYDDVGNETGTTFQSGLNVTIAYDALRLHSSSRTSQVTKFVDGEPSGTTALTATFTTDLRHGRQTTYTDPNGHTWQSSFDSKGRQLQEKIPGGAVVKSVTYTDSFPASEHTVTATDDTPGAEVETFRYFDGDGQVLAMIEGRGTATVPWVRTRFIRYDGFGREIENYLPKQVSTPTLTSLGAGEPHSTTEYDGFDRVTKITRPDGAETTFVHEPKAVTETSPRGTRTRREMDESGEVVHVLRTDAAGALQTQHWLFRDALGAIVRVIDGDGSVRHIERDSAGRLSKYDLPHQSGVAAPTSQVCHDGAGRPVQVTTAAGRQVFVARDEAGRAVAMTGVDAQGSLQIRTFDFDGPAGNGLGRLVRSKDRAGEKRYTYDALTRPATVQYDPSVEIAAGSANIAPTYTTTFSYSPRGGLRGFTLAGLPQPISITYERDEAGRTRVLKSGGRALVTGVEFDPAGRMIETRLGNGTKSQRAYDPNTGVLRSSAYLSASGASIESLVYDYDENLNLTSERRSQAGALAAEKTHTYDALDRLVGSELWTASHSRQELFSYTPAGNISAAAGSTYAYADPANSQGTTSLTKAGAVERTLSYSADGDVVTDEVIDAATGVSTLRAIQTDAFGCATQISNGAYTTELFCGDGGKVVGRRTVDEATGNVSARIELSGVGELRPAEGIFLARIPLGGAAAVEEAYSLGTGALDTTKSGYLAVDVRGSVVAKTSYGSSGAVKSHEQEYGVWGDSLALSALPGTSHQFTDAEPDPGTGFYHYGPRTYDPQLRRWLSPDPLIWLAPERQADWGQQLNLYGYASNSPATVTDKGGYEGDSIASKARSLFEFGASAMAGALYGAAPFAAAIVPPPPIATDTKTQYAQEHRVGFATGEIAGGAYQMATGAQLAGSGGGGAVGSGGVLTVPAAVAIAGGVAIMYSGAVAVTKGGAVLVNEVASQMSSDSAGEGVIYGRTDPKTGEKYVGQAKSPERYEARQKEHDKKLGAKHEYEILEGDVPEEQLDEREESAIRREGGLKKEGGELVNKRHQMSDERYEAAGGTEPKK